MELTPIDILNKEFRKGVRGYRVEEVDKFLDTLSKDYEAVYAQNRELYERIQRLEGELSQYKQIESTLQQTMVIAQQTAEELKKNAEQQAELTIREAELKKEKILNEAHQRLHEINEEIEELKNRRELIRTQLKTFLQAQLELASVSEEGRVS